MWISEYLHLQRARTGRAAERNLRSGIWFDSFSRPLLVPRFVFFVFLFFRIRSGPFRFFSCYPLVCPILTVCLRWLPLSIPFTLRYSLPIQVLCPFLWFIPSCPELSPLVVDCRTTCTRTALLSFYPVVMLQPLLSAADSAASRKRGRNRSRHPESGFHAAAAAAVSSWRADETDPFCQLAFARLELLLPSFRLLSPRSPSSCWMSRVGSLASWHERLKAEGWWRAGDE